MSGEFVVRLEMSTRCAGRSRAPGRAFAAWPAVGCSTTPRSLSSSASALARFHPDAPHLVGRPGLRGRVPILAPFENLAKGKAALDPLTCAIASSRAALSPTIGPGNLSPRAIIAEIALVLPHPTITPRNRRRGTRRRACTAAGVPSRSLRPRASEPIRSTRSFHPPRTIALPCPATTASAYLRSSFISHGPTRRW